MIHQTERSGGPVRASRSNRVGRVAVAAVVAALVMVGCSSSSDSSPATSEKASDSTAAESTTGGDATTTTVSAEELVTAAAEAYYAAVQSGDMEAVRGTVSKRCAEAITQSILDVASSQLKGASATFTIESVEIDTAAVMIDSEGIEGDSGSAAFFRIEGGRWIWDGCP